jgi:hypothetical protein
MVAPLLARERGGVGGAAAHERIRKRHGAIDGFVHRPRRTASRENLTGQPLLSLEDVPVKFYGARYDRIDLGLFPPPCASRCGPSVTSVHRHQAKVGNGLPGLARR